ncbi:MAG: isoprenylcysteine carboxylmethyltransferase family protein [Thermodesulfovibrionales bacterium]
MPDHGASGYTAWEAAALVAAIFIAFAFLHSLCVMSRVKGLMRRLLGDAFVRAFYRLLYTVFSVLTTAAAVYLITLVPDHHIFRGPAWFRWPMHGAQAAGLLIGLLSFNAVRPLEFVGLAQAWRYIARRRVAGDAEGLTGAFLVKTGMYSVVRHPLYLAGIIIFTFEPNITRNWLTVSVLADLYFIYGALAEERRLLARFGDEYKRYMEEVPRFLPRLRR